ncbi:SMP-30/gluconolactonase/LRE family protein [Paenibacillus thailandensis]|uniref:SMP-30/gluconolactonase/LRE family protein n=1 Tax=Paenibacillus thailandensis TaxID=393250 RepID=A0ABW5R260_9BACL
MKHLRSILTMLLFLAVTAVGMSAAPRHTYADVMYNTFTRDGFGKLVWGIQPSYTPEKIIGHDLFAPDPNDPNKLAASPMRGPQDVFVAGNDEIYVADTGNNRIVHFAADGAFIRFIAPEDDPLSNPQGVFVTEDGHIYVADTGNKRIVKLDPEGRLLQTFGVPDSRYIPSDLKFDPIKLVVDKRGYIYVVTLGGYYGAIQLDANGQFAKFYGMNAAPFSAIDAIKKALYTREMYENELSKLPPPINNIAVDANGFVYTVTSGEGVSSDQIKKLNFEGQNILSKYNSLGQQNSSFGEYTSRDFSASKGLPVNLVDVAVDYQGNFVVIDKQYKYVSQYDANGELLFFWGGQSASSITQLGLVKSPVSIAINSKQDLFILDDQEGVLQKFRLSEFGALVYEANGLTLQGKYLESERSWEEVIKLNAFYTPALRGLAKAAYKKGDYEKAAELYHQSGNEIGYSESFWQIRLLWMQKNFSALATGLVVAAVALIALKKGWRLVRKRLNVQPRKRKSSPYAEQLKHAFYVLKHPLDGLSALRFEYKGSVRSALTIYFAGYLAIVVTVLYTSFSFNKINLREINIYMILLQYIVAIGAWVVCNYLISSIYRGEGRFRDTFIGSAYALVPLIVIGVPLALLSNVMTLSEAPIFYYIRLAMYVWIAALFFWKVQSLQNYSVGETAINIFLTVFAIAVLAVLALIMVGLTNELRIFLYEVYQEVTLR